MFMAMKAPAPAAHRVTGKTVVGFDLELLHDDPIVVTQALLEAATGTEVRLAEVMGPRGRVWAPNRHGALAAVGAGPYVARFVRRDPDVHLSDHAVAEILERVPVGVTWTSVRKCTGADVESDLRSITL